MPTLKTAIKKSKKVTSAKSNMKNAKRIKTQKTTVVKKFVHPELKEGEKFLKNISKKYVSSDVGARFTTSGNNSENVSISFNFAQIKFSTKRLGRVAYDEQGEEIEDQVPVFVNKNEETKPEKRKK